jgi:hypothetical protein
MADFQNRTESAPPGRGIETLTPMVSPDLHR